MTAHGPFPRSSISANFPAISGSARKVPSSKGLDTFHEFDSCGRARSAASPPALAPLLGVFVANPLLWSDSLL